MNQLVAAISGWGKSRVLQTLIRQNLPNYDHAFILDYCDEYRGLVKAGLCDHWIVGPREAEWSVETWRKALRQSPRVVLARLETLPTATWRETCGRIVQAGRTLSDPLFAVDEAHFVVPQRRGFPTPLKELATTGRGQGASAYWVSQRLTEVEETILAQCNSSLLGGFDSDNDLKKLPVEYPREVHRAGGNAVPNLPAELHADDGAVSVRRWEEDGKTVGSEWVYSDDSGERRRLDTGAWDFETEHYGQEGNRLEVPG